MSPEEKEKQVMLMQRKADMAEKAKKEREHAAHLKQMAEFDRQEKAG